MYRTTLRFYYLMWKLTVVAEFLTTVHVTELHRPRSATSWIPASAGSDVT